VLEGGVSPPMRGSPLSSWLRFAIGVLLFLPANRAVRRSLRSAARYNAFDSNGFHNRFKVRPPEYNRKRISLIMGITGDESESASSSKTSLFLSR
jgi:hypothetical protein